VHYLLNICPEEVEVSDVELLISSFEHEVYKKGYTCGNKAARATQQNFFFLEDL
jgi:hypothetical protein